MRELTHAQLKTAIEMRQSGVVWSVVARCYKLNPAQLKQQLTSNEKANQGIHGTAWTSRASNQEKRSSKANQGINKATGADGRVFRLEVAKAAAIGRSVVAWFSFCTYDNEPTPSSLSSTCIDCFGIIVVPFSCLHTTFLLHHRWYNRPWAI